MLHHHCYVNYITDSPFPVLKTPLVLESIINVFNGNDFTTGGHWKLSGKGQPIKNEHEFWTYTIINNYWARHHIKNYRGRGLILWGNEFYLIRREHIDCILNLFRKPRSMICLQTPSFGWSFQDDHQLASKPCSSQTNELLDPVVFFRSVERACYYLKKWHQWYLRIKYYYLQGVTSEFNAIRNCSYGNQSNSRNK